MSDNNDLREQLATVRNRKEKLEEEKDELKDQLAEKKYALDDTEEQLSDKKEALEKTEEQLSEMESTLEQKRDDLAEKETKLEETQEQLSEVKSKVENKEDTIEQQSDRISKLEEEVAPLKELLAEIAAEGSMLDPEKIASTHDTRELVDMLADSEDDSQSYSDKVREQLSAQIAPRGDPDSGSGSGTTDPEELDAAREEEVEQLAESVMTAQDWKRASDFSSNREYIRTTKGVDPATAGSEEELRHKINSNAAGDGSGGN